MVGEEEEEEEEEENVLVCQMQSNARCMVDTSLSRLVRSGLEDPFTPLGFIHIRSPLSPIGLILYTNEGRLRGGTCVCGMISLV